MKLVAKVIFEFGLSLLPKWISTSVKLVPKELIFSCFGNQFYACWEGFGGCKLTNIRAAGENLTFVKIPDIWWPSFYRNTRNYHRVGNNDPPLKDQSRGGVINSQHLRFENWRGGVIITVTIKIYLFFKKSVSRNYFSRNYLEQEITFWEARN